MVVDAAQLWKLNHRLLTVALDGCRDRFDELGIEAKEYFVLAEVDDSPYPAELAAVLVVPKASVTVYVRNLVAKGLLHREIDAGDLRKHRLALTSRGREVRDEANAALAAEFDRRLAVIGDDERERLRRTLEAVLAGDAAAPR
jgi:DNA-binding MarR family transcriptional regulator